MSQHSFLFQLSIITIIFAVLAFITEMVPALASYAGIFWLSIGLFFFLSLLMYFFAKKAALSPNKYAFTNVHIASVVGKLFLSIILLISYKKLATPEDNFFIIPFFLVYLIYTAFETNFMIKLGRLDSNQSSKQ